MKYLSSSLLVLLTLAACNPEQSPFMIHDGGEPEPQPEPEARIVDLPVFDMTMPVDMPDVPDMDGVDMPDMAPPGEPPPREATIVLTNRDDGYAAWVRGGRLFSAHLPKDAEAFEPAVDVADASSFEGRLRGYRLTGSRPYVVLPSGEGGMLQAVDLTGRSAPTDLGMYPPFDVFLDGEVLLVGQLGPEPDAQRGWRLIEVGNALGPVFPEIAGFGLPRSAAQAMGGWVIGFADEACLDTTRTAVLEAPWLCHGRPGARLVGDGAERLSFVGPTNEGIRMWQAMPAVAAPPEGGEAEDVRVELARGSIIDWFPQPTLGQLMHVSEDGGAEALWWVRATQTQRAEITDPDTILGLSVIRSDIRVIRWDAEADGPVPDAVEFAAGPVPPVFAPPMECNAYGAEQCGGDQDCNGITGGSLCCRDIATRRVVTRLPLAEAPNPQWFAGWADVGLLLLVVIENQARLLNHPEDNATGAEARAVGTWDGVVELRHFNNRLTRVVAHADVVDFDNPVEEGMPPNTLPGLLWFTGQDGPTTSSTPCAEVLGLRILDGLGRTRVWCADGAVDVEHGQAMGDPVPYPDGIADVKWIEPNALGNDGLYLVAHGDEHTLALWQMAEDFTLSASDEALPMAVTQLAAEDRVLPFRLPVIAGGRTARVADGVLQLLVPGAGWQRVPGTAWPIAADISRYEPVAVSMGLTEHPTADDSGLRAIGYYLHSLQPGTQPWGQRYNPEQGTDNKEFDFHGVHFGDYPQGLGRPVYLAAKGNVTGGNASVGFEGTLIQCEP